MLSCNARKKSLCWLIGRILRHKQTRKCSTKDGVTKLGRARKRVVDCRHEPFEDRERHIEISHYSVLLIQGGQWYLDGLHTCLV
jgi:hypothetical protein